MALPAASQPHRDPAEDRPEAVVQVAADPAAVVLPAEHQPLAALLQLGGEQAGADRDRRLAHEVDQQPLVAPRQHRAEPWTGSTSRPTRSSW